MPDDHLQQKQIPKVKPVGICLRPLRTRFVLPLVKEGMTCFLGDQLEDGFDLKSPTSQYIYEAYGKMLQQPAGLTNPYTFVGRQGYQFESALDQYYLRARFYDPNLAAFLSRDPIGFQGSINLYDYVLCNPVGFIDPSGLIHPALLACIFGAAIGIIGSLTYDWFNNDLESCRLG